MIPPPSNREALGLIAGFGIWGLAFLLLYGGHGLACSTGTVEQNEGAELTRLLLLAGWVALLVAHAGLIAWFFRRLRAAPPRLHFIRLVSLTLAIAALAATVWTGLPVTALRLC